MFQYQAAPLCACTWLSSSKTLCLYTVIHVVLRKVQYLFVKTFSLKQKTLMTLNVINDLHYHSILHIHTL